MLKLYQLYALSQIEKNKGWYLEDGYMEAVKTKAARWLISCVGKLDQMLFL
jgi:acyl-CoA oxidase